ncbi:3-oxoacyl-[acyl-carrier-protein] synthase III C-terminal domain-containing protein [Petrachloros mirabilis]
MESGTSQQKVFIAATATLFPAPLSAADVADKFYPIRLCSERTNKLAKRVTGTFGIKQRTICIDYEKLPKAVVSDKEQHPLAWCVTLIAQLSKVVPVSEIGYVGIAYNTTTHTNNLPNLACQSAMRSGINPDIAPEEFANYGCAAGLFPLETAFEYCRRNQKAAVVIVFDQCNSRASFCYDPNDPMFRMDLKCNLLFSDGAAAVLVIPERMKELVGPCLPKIDDISISFSMNNMIRFDDERFILEEQVKDVVPPFVADSVIKLLLAKSNVSVRDIDEWSIHQGSNEILGRFTEPGVLGLSDFQVARSRRMFGDFGNMSAPSCFLVLDSFCGEPPAEKRGKWGMVVGFGAGFYAGALLYRWE